MVSFKSKSRNGHKKYYKANNRFVGNILNKKIYQSAAEHLCENNYIIMHVQPLSINKYSSVQLQPL